MSQNPFESLSRLYSANRAEKFTKKLAYLHSDIVQRAFERHCSDVAAALRLEGYQRGRARIIQEFEWKMKEMGMVAARVREDERANNETEAKTLVFKIPISDYKAYSMMFSPGAEEIKKGEKG